MHVTADIVPYAVVLLERRSCIARLQKVQCAGLTYIGWQALGWAGGSHG
jgi:hypothetical protein